MTVPRSQSTWVVTGAASHGGFIIHLVFVSISCPRSLEGAELDEQREALADELEVLNSIMDKDVTIEDDGVWSAHRVGSQWRSECPCKAGAQAITTPLLHRPCQHSGSGCDSRRYEGRREAGAWRDTDSCADPKAQSLSFGASPCYPAQ